MSRRSRGQWFSAVSFLGRGKAKRGRVTPRETRPLRLESLEDRRLLATYYLTHSNDDMNVGSLRWAITQANANPGPDTIDTVEQQGAISIPHDINLTLNGTALPLITDDLTIIGHTGSGIEVGRLTVSGNNLSRVLRVDFDVTLNLSGATIKEGVAEAIVGGDFYSGYGGAILNFGTLNIYNSTITDSRATRFGGGIVNFGTMAIANSTISANEAPVGGGMVNGGALTITNSTFAENLAANSAGPAQGGGLSNQSGTNVATTLDRVTFQGNAAVGSNGMAGNGGGVYVARGIFTMIDCTISNNTAQGGNGGSGVIGTNAPPTPAIPAGQSGAQGGTGGTGGAGGAGLGGGVYVNAGQVTSLRTTISGNLARGGAGGIGGKGGVGAAGRAGQDVRTDTFGGIVQLATPGGRGGDGGWGGAGGAGGAGAGGGVYHFGGSLDVSNSTIANNQTAGGVGGMGGQGGAAAAGGNGGNGSLSAALSTNGANGGAGGNGGQGGSGGASGAANGGGLVHAAGTLRLVNATIANNQVTGGVAPALAVGGAAAPGGAGGIGGSAEGLDGSPGAAGAVGGVGGAGAVGSSSAGGLAAGSGAAAPNNVFLANTIVAQNSAGGAASDVTGSVDPLGRRNLVGVGGAGGLTNGVNGNLIGVVDARLGTLANNGGPTQTIALLHDSPALNAGENASAVASDGQPQSSDQRGTGFQRIVGAFVDIGAFESPYGAESLLITTLADEDNGFSNPALGAGTSLREAINWANLHAGADTITFASALGGGVIMLGGTQLPVVSGVLAINGLGAAALSISGNNASRILEIAAGANATLSGISIINGYASRGGGIYNLGTLAVDEVAISANVAFGTTLITDIFSSATSDGGGGIFNAGSLFVADSTLVGNSATLFGGGLTNAGVLTVTGSSFSGNSAAAGGGVYNNQTLTISHSTLANNSATGTSANFGFGGGGGLRNDATATLTHSTLANNSATRNGGGIFNLDETISLLHCTLSGNRADADGNDSRDTGGGVFTSSNPFTFTHLRHTIVAGNFRGAGGGTTAHDLGGKNAEPGSVYNLIGAAGSAAGLVDGQSGNIVGADPKLGPLAENGGPTQTFALLAGSPAINAGDPAFDPNTPMPPLVYDQRGASFSRILGGRIDIGAVEVPSGDFNGNGLVDGADFLAWQRQYGSTATPSGSGADGNGSGNIDGADLNVWREQFGQPSGGTAAIAAAPASVMQVTVATPAVAAVSDDESDEFERGLAVETRAAAVFATRSDSASSRSVTERDAAFVAIAQHAEAGWRARPAAKESNWRGLLAEIDAAEAGVGWVSRRLRHDDGSGSDSHAKLESCFTALGDEEGADAAVDQFAAAMVGGWRPLTSSCDF